jgi:hypothetical protein
MNDPNRKDGELDRLLRTAPAAIGSGVRSGVRGVALFLGSGVAYGALIGKIEQLFYEIPYIVLGLWLITGVFIFRACDRGDL